MKNALTLIGGILTSLGVVFVQAAQNTTMWWVGMSFSAVGPTLLASRGIFETTK